MTLTFKHFDTRLSQWIHTDGNTNNPDSILTEKLDNTLLEFFFPDKEFSFGQMDEKTTAEDLKNHPEGQILLFSSKTRLVYGSPECLEIVERLCPDRKDRGAYGSIFLGSCKNALTENVNILIVDDSNGENGGFLANELAWELTGDCYGQISHKLYDKFAQREKDEPYHILQHRIGWRPQDGQDTEYRFGKGTLRPYKLEGLSWKDGTPKVDFILPLSSFKGTDKDNPNGTIKPQIKPGLYNQTIWIGEKERSRKSSTAISQLLASFPQGIKDFAEQLEAQALSLAQIQNDPRQLAQKYCEKYENRKQFTQEQKEQITQEIIQTAGDGNLESTLSTAADNELDSEIVETDEENPKSERDDLFMYKLIKADLMGHAQLLETEKVKQELSRFLQNEWRDIAIGKTLTFDRGMIIPSKELKNGEISVSWLPEAEKVLNFRSPFLNSNGLCVSLNKHVEDFLDPKGNPIKGAIIVNDETHSRIQARIQALEDQLIAHNEIDPAETESERQGRDFDGDCIGVELAKKYPNLTEEAERRNLPENAYAPTIKEQKKSFYREDGSQPEFEEIAIFMSDGISVGVINNHVTAVEALESEIDILMAHGTFQEKSKYLDKVSSHYQQLFVQENSERNPKPIRETYRDKMQEIVELASAQNRTESLLNQALTINRNLYHSMIEEGCYQNQIAVDMFKSARAPDMDILKENKRYLYRDVNYIKDKKAPTAYLNKGIESPGYSPVELLISQANKYFQASQLESRPIVQFADLFKGIEFTPQQKYEAILAKDEFDRKFNEATRMEQRRKIETGPYAIVQTQSGTRLEITNLTRYEHPRIWQAKHLNIELKEIPERLRSQAQPHTLLAVAQIDGEMENGRPLYRDLGTISQQSVIDHHLKAGMKTEAATLVEIKPELRKSQTKVLFQQAYEDAKKHGNQYPIEQRLAAAAAAWDVSATRQDEVENKKYPEAKKVSNFVFAALPEEIISQLKSLQFDNLKLLGIGKEGNAFDLKVYHENEQHEIEIRASHHLPGHPRHGQRLVFVKDIDGEFKEFSMLEARTGRLPIGTAATAQILPGEAYTAKASLNQPGFPPVEFTIREIGKFAHAGKTFNEEQVNLSFGKFPVPDGNVKVKIGDKTLGELDKESVNVLQETGLLDRNQTLKLTLKSIGAVEKEGHFIIGCFPDGKLIRINKVNQFDDFKKVKFDDTQLRSLSLEIPQTKIRDAVFLDGELLGVLHKKDEREALENLGLLKFKQTTSVPCNLKSNFTVSFLKIDPQTVKYPEHWTKESQAFNQTQQLTQDTFACHLLKSLTERPTLLFTSSEDKVLGVMGLAVDNHKEQVVRQWLELRGIEFVEVPKEEAQLQTEKGLTVFQLATNTIEPEALDILTSKFGKPLEGADYFQQLKTLPDRPEIIANDPEKIVQLEQVTEIESKPSLAQIKQDILEVKEGIIVQQVNCQHKMGAGLASAIANKWPQVKQAYFDKQNWQLGDVQFVTVSKPNEPSLAIANVAGQYNYSTAQRQTNFEALKRGLAQVNQYAKDNNLPIYIPSRLGSGLAGGKTQQEKDATWAIVKEIIAQECPTATICAKPQELNPTISGKPIPMTYPLMLHGEPNPLPVSTCIDAMRGYGRCHTTRSYEPYKQYGFKEGDIAIADGGSVQVAFRVGKQYPITKEMIADPTYQQQWAEMEKHNAKALPHLFKDKTQVWGLHMEPLGDYVDGKILPFTVINQEHSRSYPKTISAPINIGSRSSDPLGAALTNPTLKAKQLGKIHQNYPVSFLTNSFVPAGSCRAETWPIDKPAGVPFVSAEQAYQYYKETVTKGEPRVQLMTEIIAAKLQQHPRLFEAIKDRGGVEWLESCTHYVTSSRDNYWEGKGKDSPFIRALIAGYSGVLERAKTDVATSQAPTVREAIAHSPPTLTTEGKNATLPPKTCNPLANIQPLNEKVARNFPKDRAMAEVATQFIGTSANPNTPSSTANYEKAWGELANTGVYSTNDIIMVSGNGPWRASNEQIETAFKNHYVPLLEKARASRSSFVVGNAPGTDQLVQNYLKENGYSLEQVNGYTKANPPELTASVSTGSTHPAIPQAGVMAETINTYEQTTLETLRTWYAAADKLGKSSEYLARITEVADSFKAGQALSEPALIAMNKDLESLRSLNRLTQITQRIADVLGTPSTDGSTEVKSKDYDLQVNPGKRDLLISQKDGTVVLDIKSGEVQTHQVNAQVISTFEEINSRIDSALSEVKKEYLNL